MGITTHAKSFAPPKNAGGKVNLIGLDLLELKETLVAAGLEPFRTKQVWSWIYFHGVTEFSKMTTLAKPAREILAAHFSLERPKVVQDQKSNDGTRKWLLRMHDGQDVETVHIPEI